MELVMVFGGDKEFRRKFKEECEKEGALFYHEVPSSKGIPKEVMEDINKVLDEEYKNR